MNLTKKGFSALEMQRLLSHSRYESIWLMMQKICISMGHKDDSYTLEGYIEMDEVFFEGHCKKGNTAIQTKPVNELDRLVKAIVAVSAKAVAAEEQKDYCPNTKCGFVKMNVVKSLCTNEVLCEAGKMIHKSPTVITDGRGCYKALKDICTAHKEIIVKDKTEISKIFPWVHTAISNAKKNTGVASPGKRWLYAKLFK